MNNKIICLMLFEKLETKGADNSEKVRYNSNMHYVLSGKDEEELTPTVVDEFIKKIVVYAPNKSSGYRVKKEQIFYSIGEFTP